MGFRGGGSNWPPPQHILVFKYPSIDRVKIFLNHWCCSVSMYLLFKGIVKVISNDSCTLRILQSNNKNIIFLAKNCSFCLWFFSEVKWKIYSRPGRKLAEFISFEIGTIQNIHHISIFKRKVLGIVTTVLSYQICLKALKKD